jgi:hypothetical protein
MNVTAMFLLFIFWATLYFAFSFSTLWWVLIHFEIKLSEAIVTIAS